MNLRRKQANCVKIITQTSNFPRFAQRKAVRILFESKVHRQCCVRNMRLRKATDQK